MKSISHTSPHDNASLPLFCDDKARCGVIQRLKSDEVDFYDIFNIPSTFKVDLKLLETKYKDLQKVLHPDKFASLSKGEQEASATTSSTINQAYQTLKNPSFRIGYLLSRLGLKDLEDGSTFNDSDLMVYMSCIRLTFHTLMFFLLINA
jgi:hypothetical protein